MMQSLSTLTTEDNCAIIYAHLLLTFEKSHIENIHFSAGPLLSVFDFLRKEIFEKGHSREKASMPLVIFFMNVFFI